MGSALTKPAVSEGPVIVKRASMIRRSWTDTLAPNRPPVARRGPAFPNRTGRVIQIDPSFLG
jgi:hypothetical protein